MCSGGIVGDYSYTSSLYILSSYNLGYVKGIWAGGIIAYAMSGGVIKNCYNAGTIEGDEYTGGIMAVVCNDSGYKDIIQNSYSMTYALYGYADTVYATAGDEDLAIYNSEGNLTETYMKDSDIIDELNNDIETTYIFVQDTGNINNGYPILSWQK